MNPRIVSSHVRSRNAVNALRLLLESHGHIVEEVAGASDFGEDLRVSFCTGDERTGYIVSIQVKSGRSLRSARGYRVPVGHHASNWAESNLPVACVVHDPDTQIFTWANASRQLRHAKLTMRSIRSIEVLRETQLNDESLSSFVAEMRGYIDGSRDIANAVEELSGIVVGPRDYVAYAPNMFGERMVFIQPFGRDHAVLIHDDFDREPMEITIEDLVMPGSERHEALASYEIFQDVPFLGEYILNMREG